MSNKHTGMFKAWYADNILSVWEKRKTGHNKFVYEKRKHVRAKDGDRLGSAWEHERIWDD